MARLMACALVLLAGLTYPVGASGTTYTLAAGDWYILTGTGDDPVYLTRGQDGGVWVVTTVNSSQVYDYLGSVTSGQLTATGWTQQTTAAGAINGDGPPSDLPPRPTPKPPGFLDPPIKPQNPPPKPPRMQVTLNPDGSTRITINPPPGGPGKPVTITMYPNRMVIDNGHPNGQVEINFGP